jgi:hypothetical protein
VTTSFVGTTAAGRNQLGDGVTATKYADLALGAAGAGPAAGTVVRATDVTKVGSGAALKGQDPNVLPFTYLPADHGRHHHEPRSDRRIAGWYRRRDDRRRVVRG